MLSTKPKESRNLIIFFIATLAWTWIIGFIPVIFGFTGTKLGIAFFIAAGPAPSLMGLIFVFRTYTKEARRDYFKRIFSFKRMGLKWPLLIILFFTLISVISIFIETKLLSGDMPEMLWINMSIKQPLWIPVLIFLSLNSGPVNEEFGWRGYSLDKLLVRFGFVKTSIILGFIWAIWHLPWYFTPGQAQYYLLKSSILDAFMFIPSTIVLTFAVTFVYLNTKRSILAGAFVHMMSNFITSQLLAPATTEMSIVIRYVSMVGFGVVIVYALCSKKFKNVMVNEIEQIKSDKEQFGM